MAKIIQLLSAPNGLCYAFEGGCAQPVACLALVELDSGDREVRALGVFNHEVLEDVVEAGAVLLFE